MADCVKKAQCVAWFIETKSDTQTQRNYRTTYEESPPSRSSIREWYHKFMTTGSVEHKKGYGHPRTSEESVERIRETFRRSPTKSVRQAAQELQMPRSTIHDVLHKRLRLTAYKVQILHAIKPDDYAKRYEFAVDMLHRLDADEHFLNRILFSDESMFHVSGMVIKHNVRFGGSEQPHAVLELQRSSEKVNVWCGLLHDRILGTFFFSEKTVTSSTYLDMLEIYAFPQLQDLQPNVLFQQDGAPPHWVLTVRKSLNNSFPQRLIGRDGPIAWPPRSPDLTPLEFFFWGYVKDTVYGTQVNSLEELK
ncbi:DUF4817 domain-containing protein [Trichonephila clavipes]|nr:DUF4817 domain-containing protein [Trichonephila clavipes]